MQNSTKISNGINRSLKAYGDVVNQYKHYSETIILTKRIYYESIIIIDQKIVTNRK